MNTVPADLFIAYNSEQEPWVHALATALEGALDVLEDGRRRQLRCYYYSVDMQAGQDWHVNMLRRAAVARRFLFVASPGSLASDWCMLEVHERIQQPRGLDTSLFVSREPGRNLRATPIGILVWCRLWMDFSDNNAFDEHVRTVSDWLCTPKGDHEHHRVKPRPPSTAPATLPEAARDFLPTLGVVLAGDSTPLGAAWRTRGANFRCATSVARAAQAAGRDGNITVRWYADHGRQPIDLPITHVCVEKGPHWSSRFIISFNNRPPKPPPTTEKPQFFREGCLGTPVLVQGLPMACAVQLPGWHQPGVTLLSPPAGALSLEGGVLFDAHGCLAGCLLRDDSDRLFAVPLAELQPEES